MDISKFIFILANRKIFFSPIDKFDDPYEGSYTLDDTMYWKFLKAIGRYDDTFKTQRAMNLKLRKTIHVNCWHINEHESDAM